MACFRCGARQTDPVRGKSPWARFVLRSEQVLMCPNCQREVGNWHETADGCPNCGSVKLVVIMDSIVCRQCGSDYDRDDFSRLNPGTESH